MLLTALSSTLHRHSCWQVLSSALNTMYPNSTVLFMGTMTTPRGIINNNPLNIRKGCKWIGLRPTQTDKSFCQFTSMIYGVRAGFITLRTYIRKHKCNTIETIISRWAPPKENNTTAYIRAVAKRTKLATYLPIRIEDKRAMCALLSAMIEVECGRAIDMDIIEDGYKLAFPR